MRKALIGLIMAATVMTPVAAQAQSRDGGEARSARIQSRMEARAARQEARQQARSEARVQAQTQAPVQVQQPARSSVNVVQRGERRGDRGDRRDRGANRPGSIYPEAWQGDPNDPRLRRYQELERRNQYRYGTPEQRREIRRDQRDDRRDWRQDRREDRRDWRDERRDDRRDWRRDRREDRRDWRDDRRDWRRDWNRSWRNDRRYDWSSWRYRNRNLYRMPRYYAPYRDWSYRRFGIGFFLEPLFFSQRYWIGNPYNYRLPAAPPGTQWVRYYDDVLLVDVYSGEVIDVIYDFFW